MSGSVPVWGAEFVREVVLVLPELAANPFLNSRRHRKKHIAGATLNAFRIESFIESMKQIELSSS